MPATTQTKTVYTDVSDGTVVKGSHPSGARSSNARIRINGQWVWPSGKETKEPDSFYLQGLNDGHLTLVH